MNTIKDIRIFVCIVAILVTGLLFGFAAGRYCLTEEYLDKVRAEQKQSVLIRQKYLSEVDSTLREYNRKMLQTYSDR